VTIARRVTQTRLVAWLDASGGVADSDADPLDDRIINGWRRMVDAAEAELAPFDPPVEVVPGKV